MIATAKALGALLGDGLIAAGVVLRDRCDTGWAWPDDTPPPRTGRMESDGPDAAEPVAIPTEFRIPPRWVSPIPVDEVRTALDELPDSTLFNIAATVIAGWKPILLSTLADLTDIDVLIAALRDRAAAFRAVEDDADAPFLAAVHPTNPPRRGE